MNDMQLLQNYKKTIEGYHGDNAFNKNLDNQMSQARKNAKAAITKNNEQLDLKIQRRASGLVLSSGGWLIMLVLVALVATLILGCFSFMRPGLSFSLEDYIAGCAEEVRSGSKLAKLYWGDDYQEILDEEESGKNWLPGSITGYEPRRLEDDRAFVQDCVTFLFGNMVLTFFLCYLIGLLFMWLVAKNGIAYEKIVGIPLIILTAISVVTILFLYFPACRKLTDYIHVTNAVFKGIFQILLGIPLMFATSAKFVLAVLLSHTAIYTAVWLYTVALKRYRESLLADRSDAQITAWMGEKAAYRKKKDQEAEAMCQKLAKQKRSNRYQGAYDAIPGHLRDLTLVNSLIWAIQNNFARDIVSARNYLDRKAHEQQVSRQMQQIQADTQRAIAAAEKAAIEAAKARAAAEAPVDVYIHYD